MTTLVLLGHIGPQALPLFRAALEAAERLRLEVELAPFVEAGLSEAYHALARRLRGTDGRLLPRLLEHAGAGHPLAAYDQVLLVTWSAPYALAEELLQLPVDALALAGWVALDSGYGSPTRGVLELARRARVGRALYWAGYTDVPTYTYPSSGDFLEAVQKAAGAPLGGFRVEHWAHDPAAAIVAQHAGSGALGAYWRAEHLGALRRGPEWMVEALQALQAAQTTQAAHAAQADQAGQVPGAGQIAQTTQAAHAAQVPQGAGAVVLRRGVVGLEAEVRAWQLALHAAGYNPGPIDGRFGPLTEAATQRLQRAAGLLVDGVVSPGVRAAAAELAHLHGGADDAQRDTKPDNLSLGLRALGVAVAELGQHEVPGPGANARIVAYRAGVTRSGHLLSLGAGDEPFWCAAFVGFCEQGEPGALPWRAAVAELWADADAAGTTRGRGYIPAPGDLAVFARAGGDPRRGGPGHVARVEIAPDARGRYTTIGGNESDQVKRTVRPLSDPALVGWIVRT
jgi:hypothetical protein